MVYAYIYLDEELLNKQVYDNEKHISDPAHKNFTVGYHRYVAFSKYMGAYSTITYRNEN